MSEEVTVGERRQLTVTRAFATVNNNPGIYLAPGKYWGPDGRRCAVSTLMIAEVGLARAANLDFHDYEVLSRETGIPVAYISGLETGFERNRAYPAHEGVGDHELGWLDGLCLRAAIADDPEVSRLLQAFARDGIVEWTEGP